MLQKIAMLTDKWVYSTVDPLKWEFIGGVPIVSNKRLVLNAGQGIKSKTQYDFTNSQAYAQVFTQGDGVSFAFNFTTPVGDQIGMTLQGTLLSMNLRHTSSDNQTIPYDAKAHAFWRMRERTGVLFWETSADGITWVIQRTATHGIDLTSGTLVLMNTVGSGFGFGPVGLGFGFGPFGGNQTISELKPKVIAGYFAKYKSTDDLGVTRDMDFSEIDDRYNTVFLFQAGALDEDYATYPVGSGKVNLTTQGGGAYFNSAEWKTGVQGLRKKGVTILLTVGGGGAYFDMSTRAKTLAFIQSVKDIYKQVGGFDGVDFNLETSFAFIRGGVPIPVPTVLPPAISVSSDGLTITDIGLLNRTRPYVTDPWVLQPGDLTAMPFELKITTGTGAGQYRNIVANTDTTITVDLPFEPIPDATSLYEIGVPLFVDEIVFAAQTFRALWGKKFSISVPAAGTFYAPFIQHDWDLVDSLYNTTDKWGQKLLDFLAPQYYDLWYDQPDTTDAARAAYAVSQAHAWAARVNNDWSRIGMGFLTNGAGPSRMSPDAARIAYLLVQVDNPTIRGAFHFDIQGDRRQDWEWVTKLEPIIEATTTGEGPQVPSSSVDMFDSSTGWTLAESAAISGGVLSLPSGDYGNNPSAVRTTPISLSAGYMQIDLASIPAPSSGGAHFNFGFKTTSGTPTYDGQGMPVGPYVMVRLYEDTGAAGYEFRYNTGAGNKVTYLVTPRLSTDRYIRIRLALGFIFVSIAGADGVFRMATFETASILPSSTGAYPFIYAGGLSTGGWTATSFNEAV